MLIPKNWQLPAFSIHEFSTRKTKYCVVIPILNEGAVFRKQLIKMNSIKNIPDLIIVDGNSTDNATNPNWLKKNRVKALLIKTGSGGLSSQLRLGFAYGLIKGYQGIITIDGNGKDDVNDINKFIQKLNSGYDFIQGSRFLPGGGELNTPKDRLSAIRFLHAPLISIASGFFYTDTTNDFRGYSAKVLKDIRVKPFRNIFKNYELLAYLSVRIPKLGFNTQEIPVTRSYPKNKVPTKIYGKEKINLLLTLFKTILGKFNP